jgi:hypothetical protein
MTPNLNRRWGRADAAAKPVARLAAGASRCLAFRAEAMSAAVPEQAKAGMKTTAPAIPDPAMIESINITAIAWRPHAK